MPQHRWGEVGRQASEVLVGGFVFATGVQFADVLVGDTAAFAVLVAWCVGMVRRYTVYASRLATVHEQPEAAPEEKGDWHADPALRQQICGNFAAFRRAAEKMGEACAPCVPQYCPL